MGWTRGDDGGLTNPRFLGLGKPLLPGFTTPRRQRSAVFAAMYLMANWTGRFDTDGWVPDEIAEMACGDDLEAFMRLGKRNGFVLGRRRHVEHGMGWAVNTQHVDRLIHVETKDDKATRLEAARTRRIPKKVKDQVVLRDGDVCRYGGERVDRYDTRGGWIRSFDHIDPDGPSTVENLVVACKSCNSSKADGNPFDLRPEPLTPVYNDSTVKELTEANLLPSSRPTDDNPRPARPVDDLRDRGTAPSGDDATLAAALVNVGPLTTEGARPTTGVGRVGSGRAGPARRGGRRHQPRENSE